LTGPCTDCTRGCCFQYTVTITGYDAWKIARKLQLAPEQFLVTIPQKSANERGFLLDDSERTFDIALDKAPQEAESQPCVFWIGFPGGIGRCGIYPWRPYACQVYPARLNSGIPKKRDDVLCPDDAWRDGSLRQPIWRERLLRLQVEYDIYGLAAARWNYHVRNTPARHLINVLGYYTYLTNFYGRLEPMRDSFDDREWMELSERWGECWAEGFSPLVTRTSEMEGWFEVLDAIHLVANSFFPSDLPPQSEASEPDSSPPD
jgi:Fe-S-cluster containining protein